MPEIELSKLTECETCGAAVANNETHEAWHATLTPDAITEQVMRAVSWAMKG